MRCISFALRVVVPFAVIVTSSAAQAESTPTIRELIHARLEDLMDMEVTSVSKKEEKLSDAAAAIYVITQDEIRRSGATNIPDLLRMVPGVNVARINVNVWAISIRGFNNRYANKVLVLIDGRSVYSPSFSGVVWDAHDVPFEDVERIEVIRGPGGTAWGANAVNGVINIITKSAMSTKGGVIQAGVGSETRADTLVRYGDSIGARGAYRVFGRHYNVGSSRLPGGASAGDTARMAHTGFRSDWDLSARDSITIQGDGSKWIAGETYTGVFSRALPLQKTIHDRIEMTAGNVLGRWNHTLAGGSAMSVQFYESYYHRVMEGISASDNTFDLGFQHHMSVGRRHDVVWGAGARATIGHFRPGYSVSVAPEDRTDRLFSTFVEDEVRVAPSVSLTLGSRFEHNSYTGFELAPSAQLVWTPAKQHAVWLSGARAIRQPDVIDAGVRFDYAIIPVTGVPFGRVQILGSRDNLQAEKLTSLEAGYRAQLHKRLSLDLAGFLSFYNDLQTLEPGAPFFTSSLGPPHLVLPNLLENKAHARNTGGELFLNLDATSRWRISAGWSLLSMNVGHDSASRDSRIEQLHVSTPRHQAQVRSSLNLLRRLEWDTSAYHTGQLLNGGVPGYTRVDTRLGWRFDESLEVSLGGQNLLRPRHAEYFDDLGLHHTHVPRSVFGKLTWRF
jgi:iron complex outermembrane receptor protein